MNKYIKNKKKDKLNYKKCFTKEEILFLKKYPKLYPVCKANNISKTTIDKTYEQINRLRLLTKEEIECALRMVIVAREKRYIFKENSRGNYYKKIFDKIGIKF